MSALDGGVVSIAPMSKAGIGTEIVEVLATGGGATRGGMMRSPPAPEGLGREASCCWAFGLQNVGPGVATGPNGWLKIGTGKGTTGGGGPGKTGAMSGMWGWIGGNGIMFPMVFGGDLKMVAWEGGLVSMSVTPLIMGVPLERTKGRVWTGGGGEPIHMGTGDSFLQAGGLNKGRGVRMVETGGTVAEVEGKGPPLLLLGLPDVVFDL